MKETKRWGSWVCFRFRCPACRTQISISFDARREPEWFRCPAACGAEFIPWQPGRRHWELRGNAVAWGWKRE